MIRNAKVHPVSVSPAEYHDVRIPRGNRDYPVSPSMLKEFAKCPDRWVRGYVSPDSDAKDRGNLLDTLILTPELFDIRYKVHPPTYETKGMECPTCKSVTDSAKCAKCKTERVEIAVSNEWNWKSATCQKWVEAQRPREVIDPEQLESAQRAKARLLGDETLAAFIAASQTQVLVTAEWADEETGIVVPVRCLIDLVPDKASEFAKCLGDLKITRNASRAEFARDVFKFGHHLQGAFNLDLFTAATGEDRVSWCLIVQEAFPPYQPGKRLLDPTFLDLGRTQYVMALRNYCRCLKAGVWSGYDDTADAAQGWSVIEPENWMAQRVMAELPPLVIPPEPVRDKEPNDDLIP
jgi:hypothetical protein